MCQNCDVNAWASSLVPFSALPISNHCPSIPQSMRGLGIFLPSLTFWANYFLSACKNTTENKDTSRRMSPTTTWIRSFPVPLICFPCLPFHTWPKMPHGCFSTLFFKPHGKNLSQSPSKLIDKLLISKICQMIGSSLWVFLKRCSQDNECRHLQHHQKWGKWTHDDSSWSYWELRLFLHCRVCSGTLCLG